jgi:hypothetical protein
MQLTEPFYPLQVLRLKGVVKDFEDSGCEVVVECKKSYMVSFRLISKHIFVVFDFRPAGSTAIPITILDRRRAFEIS